MKKQLEDDDLTSIRLIESAIDMKDILKKYGFLLFVSVEIENVINSSKHPTKMEEEILKDMEDYLIDILESNCTYFYIRNEIIKKWKEFYFFIDHKDPLKSELDLILESESYLRKFKYRIININNEN